MGKKKQAKISSQRSSEITPQSQLTDIDPQKQSDSDQSSVESYLIGGVRERLIEKHQRIEFDNIRKVEKQLIDDKVASQEELKRFKRVLVNHIENRILNAQKKFEESIQEELEQFENRVNQMLTNLRDEHYYEDKISKSKEFRIQMEKTFKYKPSLLTEMFKLSDYKTLYNMIVACMVALMCNLIIQDYVYKDTLFDMDTFIWCFSSLDSAIQWIFPIFGIGYMSIILVKGYSRQFYGFTIACILFIMLQIIQFAIPCYIVTQINMGFASRMILLCEGARMQLKNYSYVRNKVLYATPNTIMNYIIPQFAARGLSQKNLKLPEITIGNFSVEFKRYTYFMLAPTLIYRDNYVKAPHRSKRTISIEIANFLLAIYLGFVLFKSFCKEPILELRDNLTVSGFIICIFKLMMPSTCALILLFFGLLHSWMNAWAEILRFPDRTFYSDWWSSSEFGQFYRKWNIIVHEFLYYYVYIDAQKFGKGKLSKGLSQLLTFMISAIIHEFILYYAIGFFYPICFLLFTGPGIILIRQGQKLWKKSWVNIIFWMLMYIGASLMITLYLVEYYAREKITPETIDTKWGMLAPMIPRTFYLNL